MASVSPEPAEAGPRDRPNVVPGDPGLPAGILDLVIIVPFNDVAAVERAFAEHPGEIAGMIMEPAMNNAGLVPPDDGYLAAVKDLCHRNGALLAFDEVKTGITLSWGGGVRAFGVTPDLVCLAKAIGAGLPCGAIGGTEEALALVTKGDLEIAGTFSGNPLTMTVMKTHLTELMTPDAYEIFDRAAVQLSAINGIATDNGLPIFERSHGAKGSAEWRAEPIREQRDLWEIDDRLPKLSWLWQINRGVYETAGNKWESFTTSIAHSESDIARYVDNFASLAEALSAS
jgi:glutamate-1-semialdehyde 2,1-aminomutase